MKKYTIGMAIKAHGFPRAPEDDQLTNDFMSGFATADFVKIQLTSLGYSAPDLVAEDFGWWLSITQPGTGFRASVVFSSFAESEDDRDMTPEMRVGIEPDTLFRRKWFFMKEDVSSQVMRFSTDVFDILRCAEGIEINDIEVHST